MYKKLLLTALLSCLFSVIICAQCPDRNVLWNRLVEIRSSSSLPTQKQLSELYNYEALMGKCAYKNDSTHAFLLQSIGKLLSVQENYADAIEYTKRAVKILNDNINNPAINPSHLIRNYYNLASYCGKMNKVTEKMKYYDSCIAVASRLDVVDLYSLYAYLQRVWYFHDSGEYELCIQFASIGEALSLKYNPDDSMKKYGSSIAYSYKFTIPRVNVLLVLGRYNEAEAVLIKKIAECRKAREESFLGSLYEQLATIQMQKKNYKAVIGYLNQAFNYNSRARLPTSCKANMDNLGYYSYRIYKDNKMALNYYMKALQFHANTPQDSLITMNIYSHIANVYVRTKRYDSARHFFQCAFDQIRKGSNEYEVVNSSLDSFIQKQQVGDLTSLFIDKGDAYFDEYKNTGKITLLNDAIKVYRQTDRLLERIKTNQFEIKSKLFWRKNTHRLYEQAIEACIASGKVDEAFYFFEKSRAILLYDQLIEQHWLGENDIKKENQLTVQLSQIEKQMAAVNLTSKQHDSLQDEWSHFKESQLQSRQRIKDKNPLYYQSFLDTAFSSLRDIRKNLLKDHQAFVELFAGDSAVYAMVITADTTYFNKINKKTYDSTVNLCISYISNGELLNRHFDSFVKYSRQLYKLIFQDKEVPFGRIIISPDGRYFPFEVLVTDVKGKEPSYFLENHAVSYTYSARYLLNRFPKSSKSFAGNFMGIAPVKFPSFLHLPPLTGSNSSVEKLESFFNETKILLNSKATKSEFLDKFGFYQIIQLYTHSSDSSSEGEPVIYFADEPLYLSELNSMKQPVTELIILSACETGNGTFYQGEGVFSFNRAFAALGIPSCVNNLWSVDNESTYRLTEMFYKYLVDGLPLDRALQQAKLEFMKTTPEQGRLPYYWAAAILAGKTDAVEFKKKTSWGWIIVVAIIAIGGLFVYSLSRWARRKRIREAGISTKLGYESW